MKNITAISLVLIASTGCLDPAQDLELDQESSAIIGADDTAAGYDGVVVIRRPRAKGDTNFPADKRDLNGTGVVISPTCVLTATHVVKPDADVAATAVVFAGVDAEHDENKRWKAKDGASTYKIKQILKVFGQSKNGEVAPDFGQPEISLVEVEKLAKAAKFTAFTLGTKNPEKNTELEVTGYGLKNPWEANKESSRARIKLTVNTVYDNGTAFKAGDAATPVKVGVAPGDSGGPATVDGKLVGILSKGFAFDPNKKDLPTPGNGIFASVPYAFSKLTKEERKTIEATCGITIEVAALPPTPGWRCEVVATARTVSETETIDADTGSGSGDHGTGSGSGDPGTGSGSGDPGTGTEPGDPTVIDACLAGEWGDDTWGEPTPTPTPSPRTTPVKLTTSSIRLR